MLYMHLAMTNATFPSVFKELLGEERLCDVVIRAGDVECKAHKIILCSCSSFFRDLFCSHAASSELQVYNFPDVSPSIMTMMIEYAYTCSVVVTEDNVVELLSDAHLFAIPGVLHACWDHLERTLSALSCVGVWKLSIRFDNPGMREKAYLYTLHHFEKVSGLSVDFLQLSAPELAGLLDQDELNVKQESLVYEAVLKWINHDLKGRSAHMALLLSKVRLVLLPLDYLNITLRQNKLVWNSLRCLKMLTNTLRTLCESKTQGALAPSCTRLPFEVLVAFNDWLDSCPANVFEAYNVRTNHWASVTTEEGAPRQYCGCVHLDGLVYCVGGSDSTGCSSSVFRLSLATHTWQEVGSMHTARRHVTVAALSGNIYALGGYDGTNTLDVAERFQPDTNQWTQVAPMHEVRSYAGAAALRGKVYIFGGFNGSVTLSSAECYDPDTNHWTLLRSMETSRSHTGVLAHGDQIYVLGGYTGVQYESSVVVYDPQGDHWHHVAPMLHRRGSFGIAVLEDQLYVAGGLNSGGVVREVERYDEKNNWWESVQDLGKTLGANFCFVAERHPYFTSCFS